MKTNQQISVQLLAAVLLCGGLLACGDSDKPDTQAEMTQSTQTAEGEGGAGDPAAFLPSGLDYGGETYHILYAQTIDGSTVENEIDYNHDDLVGGVLIEDAVYERSRRCEEKLNIDIVSDYMDYDDLKSTLNENTMAGDAPYEAICARLWALGTTVADGALYDLKQIKTLDLTHDWWDQGVNESMTVLDSQFIASGDINYYDDYGILVICFNKEEFIRRGIEAPYDLVHNGAWTLEALYQIINDGYGDINGNGKEDADDFYGMVINTGLLPNMMITSDEMLTMKTEDGGYTVNDSEDIVNKATTFAQLFLGNRSVCVVEREFGYDLGNAIFPSGRSLIGQSVVGEIVAYRQSMEADFGILPFPKYDAAQEHYYSSVSQHWASAIAVPTTCKDLDKVGYVLDTLGCYSPDTVTQAVIETNVKTRSSRDEESVAILDMIFASKVFDASLVFNWSIYEVWTGLSHPSNPQFVSSLESAKKSVNNNIENFMSAVSENMIG